MSCNEESSSKKMSAVHCPPKSSFISKDESERSSSTGQSSVSSSQRLREQSPSLRNWSQNIQARSRSFRQRSRSPRQQSRSSRQRSRSPNKRPQSPKQRSPRRQQWSQSPGSPSRRTGQCSSSHQLHPPSSPPPPSCPLQQIRKCSSTAETFPDNALSSNSAQPSQPGAVHSEITASEEIHNNDSNNSDLGTSRNEGVSDISVMKSNDTAMREFDILDELEGSEHDNNEETGQSSSESETDYEEEVPEEDIDAMLEEGLPEEYKNTSIKKDIFFKQKTKVILEEIGHDHFDLLPEGWIKIMHSSGMPLYLHRRSRVVTMARPYYLGTGSSRNHRIPLSAIPCLQYKRALESEKKTKEENEQNPKHIDHQFIPAAIETFEENELTQSLETTDFMDYCKQLFTFKTIMSKSFKSWGDRKKYHRMTRHLKRDRPTLPGGTKLLKFPLKTSDSGYNNQKKEWIMNPNGKSYVCILHEYVQHALKKHPKYQFKEIENPSTPYSATVFIGDLHYATGIGASKKQAKSEAAKTALEVLIPEMKDKIIPESLPGVSSAVAKKSHETRDISIFDQIRIEDPRVAEFCAKTTEPPPYNILLTCLSRNMGLGDIHIDYKMNSKNHKQDECTMVVGKHQATVVCRNKREGKQKAAQAILQAIHPNLKTWGSLLRMYGSGSVKTVKEKKIEEQEITVLQSKAVVNQPNWAIIEKLQAKMMDLKEKKEALKRKGTLTLPESTLPSLSSADLDKINLAPSECRAQY